METNLRFALNYTRDRFKGYALNVLIKQINHILILKLKLMLI